MLLLFVILIISCKLSQITWPCLPPWCKYEVFLFIVNLSICCRLVHLLLWFEERCIQWCLNTWILHVGLPNSCGEIFVLRFHQKEKTCFIPNQYFLFNCCISIICIYFRFFTDSLSCLLWNSFLPILSVLKWDACQTLRRFCFFTPNPTMTDRRIMSKKIPFSVLYELQKRAGWLSTTIRTLGI